jgi:signal transduction histidine kinase
LAQEMNAMAQQLKRLDERKAELISIVSHDLRSPLGGIIAYVKYLSEMNPVEAAEKQKWVLDSIQEACLRLTDMVNNILDMDKIEAGKMNFIVAGFSLAEVVSSVHRLFAFSAKEKEITFRNDTNPAIALAMSDSQKIHQALTNLVSNAIKFTPEGGQIVLNVRESTNEPMLVVSVQDSGRGIAPEDRSKLFERFQRLDEYHQQDNKIRGSGLGLAITREFIEKLGGKIWVESEPGHGATFYFTVRKAATEAAQGNR